MDEGLLRVRLWDGFARLQLLLGGHAGRGRTVERDGLVASIVPDAPESPTLNAVVALDPDKTPAHLDELQGLYEEARIRRWGVGLDGQASLAAQALSRRGMVVTTASPGMGAAIDEVMIADEHGAEQTDLATVGRVNDIAYGNYDGRLERTLTPLPEHALNGYQASLNGSPASVALALHHDEDVGISFVATVPKARRKGLATQVMQLALTDAREKGCTTTTLQATEVGERLYTALGFQRLTVMQLWERRPS